MTVQDEDAGTANTNPNPQHDLLGTNSHIVEAVEKYSGEHVNVAGYISRDTTDL